MAQPHVDEYEAQLLTELRSQVRRRLTELRQSGHTPADLGDPRLVADMMIRMLPVPNPLADKVGPCYDTPGLVAWLGISKQAVDARVRKRALLGLPTAGNRVRVYPAWQFRDDGSVIPHLRDVLDILAAGSPDPWIWALWLSSRNPNTYDGLSAAEWLAHDHDPVPILDEAHADAARWAA
jgi:hypothetical protein